MARLVATHRVVLGYYAEEPNMDAQAVEALTLIANTHCDVFQLGFAYSGLDGTAAADIVPRRGALTNGFMRPWWLVELVARVRRR